LKGFFITTNAADLTWSNTASNYEVEYGVSGFTLGSGQLVSASNDTSITITSLVPNTGYDVYIRAICSANDSSAWSAAYSFTLDSTVSINQFSKSDINVYPNPNNGRFTLELDKEPNSELNITISNATGQVVHRQLITSSVNIFDLQGVRKGVYILDLFSENQSVKTRIVID